MPLETKMSFQNFVDILERNSPSDGNNSPDVELSLRSDFYDRRLLLSAPE